MKRVGEHAPSFKAQDQFGRDASLESLLREGPLVLYFYPRDFGVICTREACAFRDEHAAFTIAGATVCGVSVDSADSHRRFTDAHDIPFSLISDPDGKIVDAYGVRGQITRFAKRVTYVIDPGGEVTGVHHHELAARRHVDEVKRTLLAYGVDVETAARELQLG